VPDDELPRDYLRGAQLQVRCRNAANKNHCALGFASRSWRML